MKATGLTGGALKGGTGSGFAAPLLLALAMLASLAWAGCGGGGEDAGRENQEPAPAQTLLDRPEPTPAPPATEEPLATEETTATETPGTRKHAPEEPLATETPGTRKHAPEKPLASTKEPATKEPATEEPAPGETPEAGATPEVPAGEPGDPDLQWLTETLPEEELECLPEGGLDILGKQRLDFAGDPANRRLTEAVAECLSDRSVTGILVIPGIEETSPLSEETKECILEDANPGRVYRKAMSMVYEEEKFLEAMLGATLGTMVAVADCMTAEEWDAMGMEAGDREQFRCFFENPETVDEMLEAILTEDLDKLEEIEKRSEECLRHHSAEQEQESGT